MNRLESKAAGLRQRVERRLENKFAAADQRSKEVMDFQRRRQEAEEAKLLRLRSLRLAKEAVDRDAATKAAAEISPSATRTRRRKEH